MYVYIISAKHKFKNKTNISVLWNPGEFLADSTTRTCSRRRQPWLDKDSCTRAPEFIVGYRPKQKNQSCLRFCIALLVWTDGPWRPMGHIPGSSPSCVGGSVKQWFVCFRLTGPVEWPYFLMSVHFVFSRCAWCSRSHGDWEFSRNTVFDIIGNMSVNRRGSGRTK